MTGKDSFAPVNRLTRAQPDDLDPLLRGFDPRARPPGQDITPCPGPAVLPPLATLLRRTGGDPARDRCEAVHAQLPSTKAS